jgi:hypothetical protein
MIAEVPRRTRAQFRYVLRFGKVHLEQAASVGKLLCCNFH